MRRDAGKARARSTRHGQQLQTTMLPFKSRLARADAHDNLGNVDEVASCQGPVLQCCGGTETMRMRERKCGRSETHTWRRTRRRRQERRLTHSDDLDRSQTMAPMNAPGLHHGQPHSDVILHASSVALRVANVHVKVVREPNHPTWRRVRQRPVCQCRQSAAGLTPVQNTTQAIHNSQRVGKATRDAQPQAATDGITILTLQPTLLHKSNFAIQPLVPAGVVGKAAARACSCDAHYATLDS
jgi:hypothetical protein